MKLKHGYWQIRPQELDQVLPKVTVARFGAAVIEYHDVPFDVSNVRLIIKTNGPSAFQVDGKDGIFRVAPGMLNEAGRFACYVIGNDEHGDQVPLARGTIEVVEMKMEVSATVNALPVSYVMDANGTARQLIAVQDETGEWTLTVGKICTPFKPGIDPTQLPSNLEGADTMGKVKAAVNAISKVLAGSALALAAMFAFPVHGAEILDNLSGEDEIYTAPEIDAKVEGIKDGFAADVNQAKEDLAREVNDAISGLRVDVNGKADKTELDGFVKKDNNGEVQQIKGHVQIVDRLSYPASSIFLYPGRINISDECSHDGSGYELMIGDFDMWDGWENLHYDMITQSKGKLGLLTFPNGEGTIAIDNGDIVRKRITKYGGRPYWAANTFVSSEGSIGGEGGWDDVLCVTFSHRRYMASCESYDGATDFDRAELVNEGTPQMELRMYAKGIAEPICTFKYGYDENLEYETWTIFANPNPSIAAKWFSRGLGVYTTTDGETVPDEYESNEEAIKRVAEELIETATTSRPYLERGADGGIYVVIPE